MQRIILGLVFIAGAVGVIATGGTGAFFSDTEASTGNTFTAGAIDLKVDNESYATDANGVFAASPLTSWASTDLTHGELFFNFKDLKPSDKGEDTISLTVNNNDAYACMDMTLTSNDDKSSTEPELADGDTPDDPNNTWDGELAQNLQMFWWADDGDNVYEIGENGISQGVQTLYNLATTTPYSVALADSTHNVWNPSVPGPIPGNTTKYIAKAWCFGTLVPTPVTQDNLPGGNNNGPLSGRGMGFTCNGTTLDNLTQTDSATVDVAFRAVQSRHNPDFTCGGTESRLAKITVTKVVQNLHGGNNLVPDFHLFVDNGVVTTNVTSGTQTQVSAGNYTVGETGLSGYIASFSGDCSASGQITLNPGDVKNCTITNTDQEAHITLIKNVINNNGGTATSQSPWGLWIDTVSNIVQNNSSVTVTSNSPHAIGEVGRSGYHWVSTVTTVGNPKCPTVLGGTATLDEGESITCTITNDDN